MEIKRGVPAISRESCVIALRLIRRDLETLANGSAIERFKAAKAEFSAMLSAQELPKPAADHSEQMRALRDAVASLDEVPRSTGFALPKPEQIRAEGAVIRAARSLLAEGKTNDQA